MPKVLKNLLSGYGYNLVALPKEDIAPMLLLYKNDGGVSSTESDLQKMFKIADSAPPRLVKNKKVIDIVGNASITFDSEAGVNILDWLLQKLKMGKLSAKLELDTKSIVKISYTNIIEEKVNLLELDNYISGSEPDIDSFNTFRKKLENSELYVVSSVLKSNAFSIAVEDGNNQALDVEASVKKIVDVNVDVKRDANNVITLQHKEVIPIVFAFKAQRIIYNKKKWWQFFNKDEAQFHIKDQQGLVLKDESNFPTSPLDEGESLIDI